MPESKKTYEELLQIATEAWEKWLFELSKNWKSEHKITPPEIGSKTGDLWEYCNSAAIYSVSGNDSHGDYDAFYVLKQGEVIFGVNFTYNTFHGVVPVRPIQAWETIEKY